MKAPRIEAGHGGGNRPLHPGHLHHVLRKVYRGSGAVCPVTSEAPALVRAAAGAIARSAFDAGELHGRVPEAAWECTDQDPNETLMGVLWLKASGCPVAYFTYRRSDRELLAWWISRDLESIGLVVAEIEAEGV